MDIKETDVTNASESVDPVPYHYSAFVKYKGSPGWCGWHSYPATSKEALIQSIYACPTIESARIIKIRLPR